MSLGPTLVDQLLHEQGAATIKERAAEAILLVDKLGGNEWRFESGRFEVRLDFGARVVTVSDRSGGSYREDLDQFLSRVQLPR